MQYTIITLTALSISVVLTEPITTRYARQWVYNLAFFIATASDLIALFMAMPTHGR